MTGGQNALLYALATRYVPCCYYDQLSPVQKMLITLAIYSSKYQILLGIDILVGMFLVLLTSWHFIAHWHYGGRIPKTLSCKVFLLLLVLRAYLRLLYVSNLLTVTYAGGTLRLPLLVITYRKIDVCVRDSLLFEYG